MKFLLCLVLVLISYHRVYSLTNVNEAGPVVFVNLLWRHGERTPVNFYENDPYQNESYWPEGVGELTNEGKRQHYELGRWLRQRYFQLLTDRYSADRVYVLSTDVDRTLMSAQVNMAGMFPPRQDQVWNSALRWQPVPIHTVPEELDKVLAAQAACPAYSEEFERVLKSEEIQKIYEKYKDVVDAIRENAGGKRWDLKYIHDTWDALTIEKRRGYSIPKWAEHIMTQLYQISRYRFMVESWNKKLQRLKSGLLIQDMIAVMRNRTISANELVVKAYSAHDVTIANLLNTLGVYDGEIPPLAACVMVELRKDHRGKYYVTIFYRTSTTEDPKLLTVPGCAAACPWDRFVALAQPMIPEDWDRECNS